MECAYHLCNIVILNTKALLFLHTNIQRLWMSIIQKTFSCSTTLRSITCQGRITRKLERIAYQQTNQAKNILSLLPMYFTGMLYESQFQRTWKAEKYFKQQLLPLKKQQILKTDYLSMAYAGLGSITSKAGNKTKATEYYKMQSHWEYRTVTKRQISIMSAK